MVVDSKSFTYVLNVTQSLAFCVSMCTLLCNAPKTVGCFTMWNNNSYRGLQYIFASSDAVTLFVCVCKKEFFLIRNCSTRMAISKDLKKKLIEQYVTEIKNASNAVVVQQNGVTVASATQVRKGIVDAQWKYLVVRKRLFMRAVKEAGLPELTMEDLPWSIVLVTATDEANEFGPIKAVNKTLKELKKKADEGVSYSFLGWWFDKTWKDAGYVTELADLPTKEELISKLLFMLKHPMQSLTSVVDQIAKKDGESAPVAQEPTPEPQAPAAEVSAPVEEVKEAEPVQEEVKEETTATESTTEAEQAPTEEAAA